jgi:hypothetical protein
MRTALVILVLSCLAVRAVGAQDAAPETPSVAEADASVTSPIEPSRVHFEQGVALAAQARWRQAAEAFEASLALDDRPATRVNLVLAYAELGMPLDVVRHALPFLALPVEPHRADVRARVQAAHDAALASLSLLTTDSLPAGTELRIDGAEPALRDASGRIVLPPGLHRLEARLAGGAAEVIELYLGAGQTLAWPRQGRSMAAPGDSPAPPVVEPAPPRAALAPPQSDEPPRWRTRLAWSLASMGVAAELAALGTYAGLVRRARGLSERDPFETGYYSASNDYLRLRNSVAPLAVVGGLLMAQGLAISPRAPRWGSRWLRYGALSASAALLVSGAVLSLRDPGTIRGDVERPGRQLGAIFVSLALPLGTYGVAHWLAGRTHAERSP